jgi:hypothetical protein
MKLALSFTAFPRIFSAVIIAAGLGLSTLSAAPIAFYQSYNGSYDPASTTPPSGQSTWNVVTTGGLTIIPNNENGVSHPGVANFNDTSTSGRIQMNYAFTSINTPFTAQQAQDLWSYEVRLKLSPTGATGVLNSAPLLIGFRDEYNGSSNGKSILLGFFLDTSSDPGNQSRVGFADTTGYTTNSYFGTFNPYDDAFHTYSVSKYLDDVSGQVRLAVSIDGVSYGDWSYAARPNATANGNGFGYFGSTPYTNQVTVDYIVAVPEPTVASFLLFGMLIVGSRLRSSRSHRPEAN